MIELEVGKTYITRSKRYVKIIYKSPINKIPYLGVIQTNGHEEEFVAWYKENGLTLFDAYDIVERLRLIPWR